jgi:hypothetical protein
MSPVMQAGMQTAHQTVLTPAADVLLLVLIVKKSRALASLVNGMTLLFCAQVYVSALRLVRKMVRCPL